MSLTPEQAAPRSSGSRAELHSARRQRVPHPGWEGRREVAHRAFHPRARAARGARRRHPDRPRSGQSLDTRSAGRGGRAGVHRGADPDRRRPCSTATQELASQLAALERAHCTRVFSEKISTRIKVRPEFEKALTLAHEIKHAAPNQPVILTVYEMKRLARNAAELMALSATLQERGIGLELLTGALTGIYDPHGMGAMLFAVLAVGAELDRNYIREKALEGQQAAAAAAKGNHGGRPKVIDDDMLLFARALRDRGTPMLEITKKLVIKTGKNAGRHPSVASLYRALADNDA